MIIEIHKISPDGSSYEGEEPGEILQLDQDKFARSGGPIGYKFFIHKVGSEMIVQGTIEAPVKLLCGRCGGFFSTTIHLSSFLHAYEISAGLETLDVTPDMREDILLELPAYPKCSWEGEGVCPFSGVDLSELKLPDAASGDSRWGALEGFSPAPGRKKRSSKSR